MAEPGAFRFMMDTLPSTHYHPFATRVSNLYVRGLNRLGRARVDLSEPAVLAAARQATGLERFGDESFLPGLRVLLGALETEADLNPFGRQAAWRRIVGSLKNLLWANACFEAHPEILQRRIVAPIIIVGPHRSGTTRLHRLLGSDPRLQYLRTWEGFNPAPRPGWPELGRVERRAEVEAALAAIDRLYPGAFAAHPMAADLAEEENLLLNHCFCGFSPLGLYNIPSFYRWFLGHDRRAAYQTLARLLKLVSWSRGEPEEKRWVLKNPQHMFDLDVLLQTFPDAKLVFTHRDPLKTVGSLMSLMWFYAVQHTDAPCRGRVRDVWLDFCEQGARRCMATRDGIPASRQLDVHYEDVNRDWRAVMRRIYDFGAMDFPPDVERGMQDWLERSQAAREHGAHRYALADFGVSREDVDARMDFVRRRYAIPHEGASA